MHCLLIDANGIEIQPLVVLKAAKVERRKVCANMFEVRLECIMVVEFDCILVLMQDPFGTCRSVVLYMVISLSLS
jgi:hypothetical protein